MYVLYLDESGTHSSAAHLVVGGVAVFERSSFWLKKELEELVAKFWPQDPELFALHATKLRTREKDSVPDPYGKLVFTDRRRLLREAYELIAATQHGILFATVIEKGHVAAKDPYEVAFEDIVSRFDLFLSRRYSNQDPQRGLVVVAESNYRERLESLGQRILRSGTRWSKTKNLAEIPLFTPAENTRLLQVADLVVNAVYGRYEKGLAQDFDRIAGKFDREGERIHGLTHICAQAANCFCPACLSWRLHRSAPRQ